MWLDADGSMDAESLKKLFTPIFQKIVMQLLVQDL